LTFGARCSARCDNLSLLYPISPLYANLLRRHAWLSVEALITVYQPGVLRVSRLLNRFTSEAFAADRFASISQNIAWFV
jgi:hypothetical protein